MKVLIVDDETDVRDSIRLLVDWEDYQIEEVLEAADGAQAMELIRSKRPEIIFTDVKMPNVGGMELLQWIEAECPAAKRIVISGFDDYTYIRTAMKHGGLDYLLKPINRAELLETLRNAVNGWRKDEAERRLVVQRNVEINRTLPVYWDKLLSGVVSQPGYARTVRGDLQAAFGWAEARPYQAAMLLTDPLPRVVLHKFGRHLDLLYFLMTNVCNEILGSAQQGYAFKHTDPNYGIVVLFADRLADAPERMAAMSRALERLLGARFRLVCGEPAASADGIHASFEQALRAARSFSFTEPAAAAPVRYSEQPPADKPIALADEANHLSVAVFSGDIRQIEAAVAKWMQAAGRLPAITLEHLNFWRYEFEFLCNRLLQEGHMSADIAPPLPQAVYPIEPDGRLSEEKWLREWTDALAKIADLLRESSPKERNVIHDIKRFIDHNYMRDLSLQDIASRFFISREHISRRFKQAYGETPSEYIERTRIGNAKVLLANPRYSIAEVAEKVGYPDGRYFSKIFGKLSGTTPREYRKLHAKP